MSNSRKININMYSPPSPQKIINLPSNLNIIHFEVYKLCNIAIENIKKWGQKYKYVLHNHKNLLGTNHYHI
jgi:uncharacterized HAD superfamily protein